MDNEKGFHFTEALEMLMHDARVYCIKQKRTGFCIVYDWADDWLLWESPNGTVSMDAMLNNPWQVVYYPHIEEN